MKIPKRLEPLIDEGLIDSVVCQLMSGKEAMVYMVRSGNDFHCAKVYRESNQHHVSHRTSPFGGRRFKNSRRLRVIEKAEYTAYRTHLDQEVWPCKEVEMLCHLGRSGVRVPKFHNFFDGVLLMELITNSEGQVAPRLSDLMPTPKQARHYHKILMKQIVKMLCAGVVHGDLSQYNVLVDSQGPVIIDLPKAVNASDNHHARSLIKRDVDHLTAYFSRFAPELAQSDYATEIWSYYQRGKLPNAVLTGHIKATEDNDSTPVNVSDVLQMINTAIKKEIAWQQHKQSKLANQLLHC